jgi:hypothetical protein
MALTDADLPTPRMGSDIPTPISLDSDLPMSSEQKDLPIARDDFMDREIEGPERVHGGGPIELDLPDGDDIALEMELDAPPRRPGPPAPLGTPGAPPFGAIPTGSEIQRDSAELDLPESNELDLSASPAGGEVHRMPRLGGDRPEFQTAPSRERNKIKLRIKRPPWLMKALIALAIITLVVGSGVYLGTTQYGLFGIHLLEPMLPASGDPALVAQAIEEACCTNRTVSFAMGRTWSERAWLMGCVCIYTAEAMKPRGFTSRLRPMHCATPISTLRNPSSRWHRRTTPRTPTSIWLPGKSH